MICDHTFHNIHNLLFCILLLYYIQYNIMFSTDAVTNQKSITKKDILHYSYADPIPDIAPKQTIQC
jgi:restriction endonuclease S subunit